MNCKLLCSCVILTVFDPIFCQQAVQSMECWHFIYLVWHFLGFGTMPLTDRMKLCYHDKAHCCP